MLLKDKLYNSDMSIALQSIYGSIDDSDPVVSPFLSYVFSDKSHYKTATECGYKDPYGLFLVNENGHFLMNINFIFVDTPKISAVATKFNETGIYCDDIKDSPEYIKFWRRETIRRKIGVDAKCKVYFKDLPAYLAADDEGKELYKHSIHFTGEQYSHLNYGRINATQSKSEQAESIRKGDDPDSKILKFPLFTDGQFWYWHVKEFTQLNGLDDCLCKARRKGATYMESFDSAHTLNLYPARRVTHAAYVDDYLYEEDAISYLTKEQLFWFEEHTYWKRGLPKDLSNLIKLGFKEQSKGHRVVGWNSSLTSKTTKVNTSVVAGKSPHKIKYEEAGIFNNLLEVISIADRAMKAGAKKTCRKDVFGTGGTKNANWEGFKELFYNPDAHNFMAFANIWDRNKCDSACGFFFPQVWMYEPHIDSNGNSILINAYYGDLSDKRAKELAYAKDPSQYIIYLGQGANSPEEAFYTTSDNLFTSETLNSCILAMNADKDSIPYTDGQLEMVSAKITSQSNGKIVFKSNIQLKAEGNIIHAYPERIAPITGGDNYGCLRIFRHPYKNDQGLVPKGLYKLTYDTYGKDKDKTSVNNKNSFACIDVWMMPNTVVSYTTYKVASFVGRRDTMKDCDMIAYYMCLYYSGEICPEVDRGTCVQTFSELNARGMLMNDPTVIYDDRSAKNPAKGILIGNGLKKTDGLINLKEMIYSVVAKDVNSSSQLVLHYIDDYWLLYELANYNDDTNLDRLSSAIIWAFILRSFYITKKKVIKDKPINNSSLGTLLDKNGI